MYLVQTTEYNSAATDEEKAGKSPAVFEDENGRTYGGREAGMEVGKEVGREVERLSFLLEQERFNNLEVQSAIKKVHYNNHHRRHKNSKSNCSSIIYFENPSIHISIHFACSHFSKPHIDIYSNSNSLLLSK